MNSVLARADTEQKAKIYYDIQSNEHRINEPSATTSLNCKNNSVKIHIRIVFTEARALIGSKVPSKLIS